MVVVGPHRKFVPESHVYTFGRYNLASNGHRRKLWRKNRAQRRWLKREARERRRWRGCVIDQTAPVTWTVRQYTYEPSE